MQNDSIPTRTIQRAYKTELDPNLAQTSALWQHAGACRFIFNLALERRILSYQMAQASGRTPERINAVTLNRELTELKKTECPWLYEVSSSALQNEFRHLDSAYQNFFRRLKDGKKGKKAGFPRFKQRKSDRQSFKLNGTIKVFSDRIQLPTLGAIRLKECDYLPTAGVRITSATVSSCADRWFVSIQVEEEAEDRVHNSEIVGIDLGLHHLATLSDGTKIRNPRALRCKERKLKRAQRALSRKQKGSKNRQKARKTVAVLHYRVASARQTFLHQTTTAITKQYGVVVMEELNTAGMMKNRSLAKSIADASFFEFRRQMSYKLDWMGGRLILAGRFFPSSKTCSECGHIKQMLTLSEREFICESCGVILDRDLNAAMNLRSVAVKSTDTLNACGEDIRPVEKLADLDESGIRALCG